MPIWEKFGFRGAKAAQTAPGPIKSLGMKTLEAYRAFGGFFRGVATMFQGNRDIYSVYGYKRILLYFDVMSKYFRQDIASRIINMPCDAIWAYPPAFKGKAKVINVIDDLDTRLNLWQVCNRADKLAGLGPYSTMLIGLDDGLPLSEPVNPNRKNKVLFLQPYSYESMPIVQWETNTSSPRFGKPFMYGLRLIRGGITSFMPMSDAPTAGLLSGNNNRVHWSRVVHIADHVLEDDSFGAFRMAAIYNLLDDMLKVGGGSAEIYWLNARGGLHIDVDKELTLDAEDESNLTAEVDDYANNLRRIIRTRGVKVSPINMSDHTPKQTFEVTLNLLCASQGIPQRLLLGTEAGQLASEQDRANWAVTIKQRRMNFAEPNVLRTLFMTLATIGFFKIEDAFAMQIIWPEAFQLSPLERAQTSAQQARSVANLQKGIPPKKPQSTVQGTDGQVVVVPEEDDYILSKEEARQIVFMGADPNDLIAAGDAGLAATGVKANKRQRGKSVYSKRARTIDGTFITGGDPSEEEKAGGDVNSDVSKDEATLET